MFYTITLTTEGSQCLHTQFYTLVHIGTVLNTHAHSFSSLRCFTGYGYNSHCLFPWGVQILASYCINRRDWLHDVQLLCQSPSALHWTLNILLHFSSPTSGPKPHLIILKILHISPEYSNWMQSQVADKLEMNLVTAPGLTGNYTRFINAFWSCPPAHIPALISFVDLNLGWV